MQRFEPLVADREKARLTRGEDDKILEVQAEIEIEASLAALLLERLEGLERVTLFGSDLRKRQVGAAEFGTKRVHAVSVIRSLVTEFRKSNRNPFPNWRE